MTKHKFSPSENNPEEGKNERPTFLKSKSPIGPVEFKITKLVCLDGLAFNQIIQSNTISTFFKNTHQGNFPDSQKKN